ncbi:MAG: zinc protease [Bacteroides sp. SM23_62_1]|nr:MAG: zinc protease [Bacteroides sp. SM23_62_1]
MNYDTFTLDNGIRLVHLRTNSFVAHLALLVQTGSRDEDENEHGLAHLIEHLLFKGTKKRKAYHIISRLEDVGGELNAYTTKEETCIYASFLKEHFTRASELIHDIMFNSAFPQKEINREKYVIIDEINSYLDNPGELIFDEFEELLFTDHPLGRNILGTPESLESAGRTDILRFTGQNYATDEIVLCLIGNISFNRFKSIILRQFGDVPVKRRMKLRNPVKNISSGLVTRQKNTYQSHTIIGNTGYKIKDERRLALHLLNNILGGPGMNSRLNMALRERNGYSYHTESHYNSYTDTGVVYIYFSGDKSKLDRSKEIVFRELKKLRNNRLGDLQFVKAKRQLMGQIAISAEHHENLMLTMAKSYLIFNKVDSLEEIRRKIDAITTGQILEIANEILTENKLFCLTYI